MRNVIRCIYLSIVAAVMALLPLSAMAGAIVAGGEGRGVIVTTDDPYSSVALAARDLQHYIARISGAELPIVRESDAAASAPGVFRIYVGSSKAAAARGVTDEGLESGAYRMVSGDGWLVLLGIDTPFEPRGIYGTSRGDWENRARVEWQEETGGRWGNPFGSIHNSYSRRLDLWRFDEKGTLNAVYAFLRELGVRWYMPGEIGEIVPKRATITVDSMNRTVEPDFSKRIVAFARYGMDNRDETLEEILWTLRLGTNYPYGYADYHGMINITRSDVIRSEHPEFYAMYNGERTFAVRRPKPCLSSEGLFEEAVAYARFMFDMYDVPVVSLWPEDGFTAICQCPECAGKDTPERGLQGVLSDYVWDFINRVAIEVKKTHPDKFISGGAYSTYMLPPVNIERMSDNVLVYVVNGRRRYARSAEQRVERLELLRQWKEMTGNKVIVFMNYGGAANTPRLIAEDITNAHPYSMGDDFWVEFYRGGLAKPAYHHLNYYIALRWLWDMNQDIDAVLEEYYSDFYGPAAAAMAAFVDYFEPEQINMRTLAGVPKMARALELFDKAQASVDPDSVYGQRLALFAVGLQGLRKRYAEMKAGRIDVPTYTLARDPEQIAAIKIDGILDEDFWSELPGRLHALPDGGEPRYPTHFKIGIDGNHLYIGIVCFDEPGQPFNAELLDDQSSAIWFGDVVEILLETPHNSYYQLGVNPRGSRVDLDRGAGPLVRAFDWSSQAEFAVHADEEAGYWSIEARIPFTDSEQDPLHQIIGTPPDAENPWFFNLVRQRAREQRTVLDMSAFSPSDRGFHDILKFGELE